VSAVKSRGKIIAIDLLRSGALAFLRFRFRHTGSPVRERTGYSIEENLRWESTKGFFEGAILSLRGSEVRESRGHSESVFWNLKS
jgi:hypothetical protein